MHPVCILRSLRRLGRALAFSSLLCGAVTASAGKKGDRCSKDSDCETLACVNGTCDPCPDRNRCPAPGMCTESELRGYQSEVEKYCKSEELKRSCQRGVQFNEEEVDCADLKARLEVSEMCVKARDDVMQQCFKSGDDNHRDERRECARVRDTCREMISYKRGVNSCYSCSPSDYAEYDREQWRLCGQPMTCEERKDDTKVNCRKLEEKLQNGKECLKAQDYIVGRCFDGRRNSKRERRRQESERAVETCREVLEYKRDKNLCE